MNPTKCPNCRLSLPQNWSGANDPNAKCPYCGKSVSAVPAPAAPPPSAPAPTAPKAAAKTILWGGGMVPVRPPAPIAPPVAQPVPPPAQPAPPREGMVGAPTMNRNPAGEAVGVKRSGVILPPAPTSAAGEIDVDVGEPPSAPLGASKPNAPAPTVMFESQIHQRPPTLDDDQPAGMAGMSPTSQPLPEPEMPPEPSPAPTVSKNKAKGKQPPRKIYKPKSSLTSKHDDDDEEGETKKKPSSSKAGIIIFLVLLAIGVLIVTVVIMRGSKSNRAAPPTETSTEKSKALFEPTPDQPPPTFAPKEKEKEPAPAPKPVAEKPSRPTKPTPAPAVEKPKPEPAPAPEPTGAKPSDDDVRRASEAYQRGNAKLFAGNVTEAIAEFSLALRLNPRDPANHRALGLAYEKAGNANDAIRHLKAYLKASPKANDRAMVEKHLNQLHGK